MIKLSLKEMTRMNADFQAGDALGKKKVKDELLWIMSSIQLAIEEEARKENLPGREFEKKVYVPENFTPEEWSAFLEFSQLLQKNQKILFPKTGPKEKKPSDKGSRRNFPKV